MTGNDRKALKHLAKAALIVGIVGLTACASTGSVDALRTEVDAANAEASAARAEASAARAEAAEAKTMAANATATANEAKAISVETESKIDRMFKKAMHK
ncbi:MAG: Lpp/OprI family alanine-zipper lipoprotein [Pseudomonadota bacterium]